VESAEATTDDTFGSPSAPESDPLEEEVIDDVEDPEYKGLEPVEKKDVKQLLKFPAYLVSEPVGKKEAKLLSEQKRKKKPRQTVVKKPKSMSSKRETQIILQGHKDKEERLTNLSDDPEDETDIPVSRKQPASPDMEGTSFFLI